MIIIITNMGMLLSFAFLNFFFLFLSFPFLFYFVISLSLLSSFSLSSILFFVLLSHAQDWNRGQSSLVFLLMLLWPSSFFCRLAGVEMVLCKVAYQEIHEGRLIVESHNQLKSTVIHQFSSCENSSWNQEVKP